MRVKDRMTTNVLTVNLETSVNETSELMKQKKVRRVPVMQADQLVGIVTETDLYRAAPSSATTLSRNELNYLLAKLKIQDILEKGRTVITVQPDDFIEVAARLMREHTISGLPVLDQGKLVGIITETDIFDAFIDILGVKKQHTRVDIFVSEQIGGLAEVAGIVAQHQANILNSVVFFDQHRNEYKIILRLEGEAQAAIEALSGQYEIDLVTEMEAAK